VVVAQHSHRVNGIQFPQGFPSPARAAKAEWQVAHSASVISEAHSRTNRHSCGGPWSNHIGAAGLHKPVQPRMEATPTGQPADSRDDAVILRAYGTTLAVSLGYGGAAERYQFGVDFARAYAEETPYEGGSRVHTRLRSLRRPTGRRPAAPRIHMPPLRSMKRTSGRANPVCPIVALRVMGAIQRPGARLVRAQVGG
jgi:hypothetical protein